MPASVQAKLNQKTGMNSNVGKNPGQISGLARAENIKAWSWVASENSGGRDYNAGDFRENNPAGPPKFKG